MAGELTERLIKLRYYRSSFCSTTAKKCQDLGPAASKVLFVWMKYHQDQKCNQSKNALENR